MLKKEMTFKDLDGNDVTETFYFALNKAELAELELSHKGGLSAYLQEIIKAEDGGQIIKTFKEVIAMSVGRRSADGRRFEKSEQIKNDFMQTNAYVDLFMQLATDANAAAEFIRGLVPAEEQPAIGAQKIEDVPEDQLPAWYREGRAPTDEEIKGVQSPALLQEAFRRKTAPAAPPSQ